VNHKILSNTLTSKYILHKRWWKLFDLLDSVNNNRSYSSSKNLNQMYFLSRLSVNVSLSCCTKTVYFILEMRQYFRVPPREQITNNVLNVKFFKDKECKACDPHCNFTCVGPGPGNCSSCKIYRDGRKCVDECPVDKYPDPISKECKPCHNNCAIHEYYKM